MNLDHSRGRMDGLAIVLAAGALCGPAGLAWARQSAPPADAGAAQTTPLQPAQAPPAKTPPLAAETSPAAPQPDAERPVRYRIRLDGEHELKADIGPDGDVNETRTGATLGVMIPIGQYNRLDLDFAGQTSFYHFSNAFTLDPSGDPLGTAEYFAFSARYFQRQAERWGWFVGAGVSSSGETGAKFSDTIQGGVGLGFTYFFSEHLSVAPAIYYRSQLGESSLVVPAFIIDWDISDEWNLSTIVRSAGTSPGLELTYSPSKEWTFALTGSYESRSIRLDEEGFNPGGAFRDRRLPISVSARWKPSPMLTLEATGGVVMFQELHIDDRNDVGLRTESVDPSPFFGLQLTLQF